MAASIGRFLRRLWKAPTPSQDRVATNFDPIERLKSRWLAETIEIRPGASAEALDAFEARYGMALPSDLRAYFVAVDGMKEEDWDRNFCQFLPLGRCEPIADHREDLASHEWASRYFLLVDHSIEVFFYVIHLSPDPGRECPVILGDGPDRYPVAKSFSEFIEQYLADGIFSRVGAKIED